MSLGFMPLINIVIVIFILKWRVSFVLNVIANTLYSDIELRESENAEVAGVARARHRPRWDVSQLVRLLILSQY